MIKVIPFEKKHIKDMKPSNFFSDDPEVTDSIISQAEDKDSLAATFMHDGKPIAVFGGTILWSGNMQVWSLISDDVKLAPMEFARKSKDVILYFSEKLKLRRMQLTLRSGFDELHKWAQFLGFYPEAKMIKFGPTGEDYFLYARIFK